MTDKPIEMSRIAAPAKKQAVKIIQNRVDPYFHIASSVSENNLCWKWGEDNLFPHALSLLSRRSTVHRRIMNDKASYIAGKGISYNPADPKLAQIVEVANGSGETLRQVLRKVAFDKMLFGNAFLEMVTDEKRSFVSLFHQDASKCRLSKDKQHILLHHNWQEYVPKNTKKIPLYPVFEKAKDGTMRSILHYKEYEPMFENYGIPTYIAGMNVSAIAYKTDKWNISRLDNSFQLSGVMMLDADVDSDSEAEYILRQAEEKFAGKPGQVMFLVKGMNESESSKFIPVTSANEGDWKDLHTQATMEQILTYIVTPLVSGFVGWFASAYRNRQRKEADQIEIARQYKELLTEALEDKRSLYLDIDKLRDELRAVREEIASVKEERTLMRIAISKATQCEYSAGCPVIRDFQLEIAAQS